MAYAEIPEYNRLVQRIGLLSQLKAEHGAAGISPILEVAEKALQEAIAALEELPIDADLAKKEPDDLAAIPLKAKPDKNFNLFCCLTASLLGNKFMFFTAVTNL